jgi:hypothetical protein
MREVQLKATLRYVGELQYTFIFVKCAFAGVVNDYLDKIHRINSAKIIFGIEVIPLCISTIIKLYRVHQHNCIVYNLYLGYQFQSRLDYHSCSDYMCCYCMGYHSHLLL